MTSKARRSGGQNAPATKPAEKQGQAPAQSQQEKAEEKSQAAEKPAEEQAKDEQAQASAQGQEAAPEKSALKDNVEQDGEQKAADQPEKERTEGGNAAGEGARIEQQAAFADTLQVAGDPEPEKVAKTMVRKETGLSPEIPEGDAPTAPTGDDERNGKPLGIGTDTSGELRRADGAVPTAAHGQDARNGHVTGMDAEGQVDRTFGGNGDSAAKLAGDGVRAEVGAGTANPDLPKDERPQYPSTTLTRSSSRAAPMEPEDVKYATQPKLGDVQGSLDPTMAAAQMPSMAGDETVNLVNSRGNAVKPSNFFEVPDGIQARSFRRVKYRVSEVFTVRHVTTPSRRLLFTEGQMVPVDVAETLIRLHG